MNGVKFGSMPIPLEYVSIYAYSRTAALARLSLQCLFFVPLLLGFFFFSRHFAEVKLNERVDEKVLNFGFGSDDFF